MTINTNLSRVFLTVGNTSRVNGSLSNTSDDQPTAEWTILPIASLTVLIVAFLGNGSLLLVFIKEKSLRTPFNIYIINLLICNLSIVVLQYPMDVSNNLYQYWLLGNGACTLYLYANSVLGACMCNAHLLIAVNRMWAVSAPISYRQLHSKRVAIMLCVGLWIVIHIIVGPPVVIDTLYYRIPPGEDGCVLNVPAQYTWEVIIDAIYILPQFVMLAAFPVTWYAKWSQRRKIKVKVVPMAKTPASAPAVTIVSEGGQHISRSDAEKPESQSTTLAQTRMTAATQEKQKAAAKRGGGSHSFLVLALLTISVCICWTPNNVFYSIALDHFPDNPAFFQVQTILFILQTAIDPIIFTMALTSLRAGLIRFVKCRRALR